MMLVSLTKQAPKNKKSRSNLLRLFYLVIYIAGPNNTEIILLLLLQLVLDGLYTVRKLRKLCAVTLFRYSLGTCEVLEISMHDAYDAYVFSFLKFFFVVLPWCVHLLQNINLYSSKFNFFSTSNLGSTVGFSAAFAA